VIFWKRMAYVLDRVVEPLELGIRLGRALVNARGRGVVEDIWRRLGEHLQDMREQSKGRSRDH
jgi:hypothetical protein